MKYISLLLMILLLGYFITTAWKIIRNNRRFSWAAVRIPMLAISLALLLISEILRM